MLKKIMMLSLLGWVLLCSAQTEKKEYLGNWIGNLPDKHTFNFKVTLENLNSNRYQVRIENGKPILQRNVSSLDGQHLRFSIDDQLHFDLKNNGNHLFGYIQSGGFYYYVTLKKEAPHTYVGNWNVFLQDNALLSDELFLNIDWYNNQLEAYPFLGDQRFRGFYTHDFRIENDTLFFKDANTNFHFQAILLKETIELGIYVIDNLITKTTLSFSDEYWRAPSPPIGVNQNAYSPQSLNDGWATGNVKEANIGNAELRRLIDSINTRALVNTHSVLIAKENKLVFEAYFDGFNANIPHTMMSGSKSISSAIIGIAIDQGIIESVDEKFYDFVPENYRYTQDSLKTKIRLKHLLTMSSGMDVNDKASENYYQDPINPSSWLKTVLQAPMVNAPGTYTDYGSANPFLLGVYLNERLEQPVETFMDEKLFAPLGITNYVNLSDDTRITPYFGGGMALTPRDMLKFGQLYLNKGVWNGQQIISKDWVEASFKKYTRLQDTRDKNEYGYFWWHDTYTFKGKTIASIEARGAGGQFIFVVPELESVVVVTAGNFRNGKGNQSRELFRDYILPALLD
ncbi:MAG: serine hydrolase [Bacteroidota bacterium]